MSYLEKVSEIIENNKNSWDYYICNDKTLIGIFNNPKGFINNTFMVAGKKLLVPIKRRDNNSVDITEARAAHSISSFFLGIILAEGLLGDCDNFIKSDKNSNKFYPFSYVWNLACLFHDYGYQLENNETLCQSVSNRIHMAQNNNHINYVMGNSPYYYGIYSFRREIRIRESIWKKIRHSEYCCRRNNKNESCDECQAIKEIENFYAKAGNSVYVDGIHVTIPIRTSNDISRYFAYRLLHGNRFGCIDHGIAGGMVFFDSIIKNYAKAYVEKKLHEQNTDIMEFINQNDFGLNLNYSFEQLKIFAYIADCIMNHNVWKAEEDNIEIYQEFCLNRLIRDKFKKINFYKNPLLFILVMSDTLEPYKNFNENSIDGRKYNKSEPRRVFGKFNIVVENGKIIVQVKENLKQRCWERLCGMEDWIDIQCKEHNSEFIIILNKPALDQ